tara:strand:- start:36335 stop:37015 length:681 start_codon:yes stop_codon:yes gene_type:complete
MVAPSRQSLTAFAARQPKFHFWLLSSLGVVVLASSFLSHDKRGLLYYDEPTALLAEDLALMPEYITGGFGGRLATGPSVGGERPNSLRRTIPPRGAVPQAAGLTGDTPAQAAPAGAAAPFGLPATQDLTGPIGPALASGPASGTSSGGLPGFGSSGFAPTPIGFVPTTTSDGGSSSGGSSSGGGTPDPVVPAVPEPASWLMMIIAVFTLGSAIRRGNLDRAPLATA